MSSVVRFRVLSPFEVIRAGPDGASFISLPFGSIIETREEIRSPGLAEIMLNGQALLARMRDIEECTQPLDEPACA